MPPQPRSDADLIGSRFGRVVVVKEGPRASTGARRWICSCADTRGVGQQVMTGRCRIKANPTPTIAELEAAFEAARKAEDKAINALPERATEKQFSRCWELAQATNVARLALTTARESAP